MQVVSNHDTIENRFILSWILGHPEIKDSQAWKQGQNCWVCEKWQYTVLVTSIYLVIKEFLRGKEFDQDFYRNEIENGRIKNRQEIEVFDFSSPMFWGSFNHWKCENMQYINDYIQRIRMNSMPNPRRYVLEDGSMIKILAKIIVNEVQLWWKKLNSIYKILDTGPLERIVGRRMKAIEDEKLK